MKKKLAITKRKSLISTDSDRISACPRNEKKEKSVSFIELYRYATWIDFLCVTFGTIFCIGSGVSAPIMMLFFGEATGSFVSYATVLMNDTATQQDVDVAKEALQSGINYFTVGTCILGALTIVCSYSATMLFNATANRQVHQIRTNYVKSVLNQDISWHDVHKTGDFASRISEDLIKIEDGIGEKVAIFLYFISSFMSGIILAFIKGWKLSLVCVVAIPLSSFSMGLISWVTNKFAKVEGEAYGSASAVAEETLSAIRTVVAFEGQSKELHRYVKYLRKARNSNITRSLFTSLSTGCMWFFLYSCIALSFWYGVKLIIEERYLPPDEVTYTPANMITVFFSVLNSSWIFGQCTPYFVIFGLAQGSAAKIFQVIDNDPIINKSKGSGKKPMNMKGGITFKDVHFHYPSRSDVKVLQGINITINPGETVAFVGSSGCGKSTTIQLLQRFYDPTSGNILIDNIDIKEYDLSYLRNHIGLVGQEPVLFDVTIAENIKYGCPNATIEQIKNAATKANAHDFIKKLPKGYETLVGERGAQLSGGQKQRIAIARALVREPQILLLDEATSALDTNSEVQVQAALDNASRECTTIIIAHRLSTIRNAKRIVVISEGKVVEEGDHKELMERKGAYFTLVTSQVNSEEAFEGSKTNHDQEELVNGLTSSESIMKKQVSIEEKEVEVDQEEKTNLSKSALVKVMKLNKPEWFHILVGCLTSVLTGAALPVYSIVFGDIIGVLADPNDDFVSKESIRYSIYFFIIGVVTGVATFLQMYTFSIAGEKLTTRVRSLTFEAMLKQEIGWYDHKENGVGALCARLSTDAANVQGVSGQPIGTVLNSLSTLTLAIGFSMYFDWRLALVTLSMFPFILIAIYLEQRDVQVDMRSTNNALERAAKLAVEAISNIRTVASLGCEEIFFNLYIEQLLPYYKQSKRTAHIRGVALGLARSLMFFSYAASLYYGGVLVASEGLDYAIVFKVSESLITGAWSMGNAMAFSPNFQKALTASAKIFRFLKRQPAIYDSPEAQRFEMDNGIIEYKDVHFSYPTRADVNILKGFNLSILQSKTIALVGPSGCGKSTIVQLLERFYDPKAGTVSIDNTNLKKMTLASLRSNLGIVSQEPNLFDKTIADNIAYGDNSRKVGMDEIIEAAKNANIHNFIASLPLGYDTKLGEKGTQLSGGQKQRIAIARALVRNPKILLLDEATSALDTESEKVVQEALDNAKKGRTCITIAHRLSTIQDADVICVISNGEICEMGSHTELINKKGLYFKLHSMQK